MRRRRGRGGRGPEGEPRATSASTWQLDWPRWVLGGLFALVGAFGIGYLIAARVLFPPPPDAGDTVAVPELVGHTVAEAQKELADRGLKLGARTAVPSSDEDEGTVVAQASLAGQQLRPGAAVDVGVAEQPRQATVPAVDGLGARAATAILGIAGLEVRQRNVESQVEAGAVLRSDPAAGQPVELPGPVTLYVSQGPPQAQATLPGLDTLPPVQGLDTTGAAAPGGAR